MLIPVVLKRYPSLSANLVKFYQSLDRSALQVFRCIQRWWVAQRAEQIDQITGQIGQAILLQGVTVSARRCAGGLLRAKSKTPIVDTGLGTSVQEQEEDFERLKKLYIPGWAKS